MTVELKTIDANNPINDTMSFTSDTSIGIVRSVVSTTLSEPQYVDKRKLIQVSTQSSFWH